MIAMQRAVWCVSVALGSALGVTLPSWLAVGLAGVAAVALNVAVAMGEDHLRRVRR